MRLRPGVAIDLGTVNTLVYVDGHGLVVDEPSVIALERATGKVAAVGVMAEALSGKELEGMEVLWPLRDGVIADLDASTLLLRAFLHRAHVHRGLMRPSAVVCVPRGATLVERRAVSSIVEERSPRCDVRLVEEPVAAAVGAGTEPSSARGTFVVDVGGGTTEVAVVVADRAVRARSLRLGGNAMDEAVGQAVKSSLGLTLGRRSCERLKFVLGLTGGATGWAEVTGVDAMHEQLRTARVTGELVADALDHIVGAIDAAVHEVLSELPPDLAEDVVNGGIHMAGGGSLLMGLADRLGTSTGIETFVVDDPLRCVLRGAADLLGGGNTYEAPKRGVKRAA